MTSVQKVEKAKAMLDELYDLVYWIDNNVMRRPRELEAVLNSLAIAHNGLDDLKKVLEQTQESKETK